MVVLVVRFGLVTRSQAVLLLQLYTHLLQLAWCAYCQRAGRQKT
jgi:hypothetical protein